MTDAEIDKALAELSDDTLRGLVDGIHHILLWYRPHDLVTRLAGEVLRLRRQVDGHCARIAAQSELLSRSAEKPADTEHAVRPAQQAPAVGSVWKHYKGNVYTVTAVTVDEAKGAVLVSYQSPEGRAKGEPPWTRPLVGADNAFFGVVVGEGGERVPRFVEVVA